jgi:hypothetical protein
MIGRAGAREKATSEACPSLFQRPQATGDEASLTGE